MNHVILVSFLFGLMGYILFVYLKRYDVFFIATAIILFLVFPSVLSIYRISRYVENFQDSKPTLKPSVNTVAPYANATYPTARNPFMNVLVDEIRYNPGRPQAASVLDPSVKITLDDFFRTEFARDPTDVFGRSQSQREFITMPSTSIPNDVDSYQNWLYRIPGKTCKEGGREACLPGTDGAALPWLNQD
jgi:hypothetical protein